MAASLADEQIRIDGSEFYRELRQERPVYLDSGIGMYVVSKLDDILDVFRQPNLFSSALALFHSYNYEEVVKEILETTAHGAFKEVLPMTDPPDHRRVRSLVTSAFSAPRINGMRQGIEQIIDDLFNSFLDDGKVEVVAQIGIQLPVTIICDLLSLPRDRVGDIKRWTRSYTACAGNRLKSREEAEEVGRDIAEMQNCIVERFEYFRANPADNLLTDLINAKSGNLDPLTNEELLAVAAAIMVAGHETTTVAITSVFRYLAGRPGELEKLRAASDKETAYKSFCEEVLRLEPPVKMLPRVATADTELGGVAIPKGSPLMVLMASGNRDESFFEHAEEFVPGRENGARHLTFGGGIHTCLGLILARLELVCLTGAICERMDNIRFALPSFPASDYEPVVMDLNMQLGKLDILFDRH